MIATTQGDIAGGGRGLVSNIVSGPAQVLIGSPSALLGGKHAVTQLSSYASNGSTLGNTAANQVAPSCSNVMCAPQMPRLLSAKPRARPTCWSQAGITRLGSAES